jgi:hypothetical protein
MNVNSYGVYESNGLTEAGEAFRKEIDYSRRTWLWDKDLARIERLRLISDIGFPVWDVSYCWGVLKDGTKVRVQLPVFQFSKRNLRRDIVKMCQDAGVYAKGLGLLEECNISKMQ